MTTATFEGYEGYRVVVPGPVLTAFPRSFEGAAHYFFKVNCLRGPFGRMWHADLTSV